MEKQRLNILLEKYLDESIGEKEKRELTLMLHDSANADMLNDTVLQSLEGLQDGVALDENMEREIRSYLDQQIGIGPVASPIHRLSFLRRWGWAAAVILLLGMGAYLWVNNKKGTETTSITQTIQDIAPGSERAMLTLADGSQIMLDSAGNGMLAQQGNAQVVKSSDGQITYSIKGVGQAEMLMNTMSTPRGGQYQLVLPDGTKVWLNAASSITYPVSFNGKERNVKITGEVYMEVAKNLHAPFSVSAGNTTVQVLGTSFNINTYPEEENQKMTLISGSVRVVFNNRHVVLKPGQAADVKENIRVSNANVEQAIAWKNGIFDFTNMDLPGMMRQLSRWYDLDIQYEGLPLQEEFRGKMTRNLKLSDALELLGALKVKFRVQGKTLIVESAQ